MDHSTKPSNVRSAGVQLREPSTVDYESADEINASKYQVLWSNIMDKGSYLRSPGYNKVDVLLLCWNQTRSDLSTLGEVEKLKSVFEDKFGYHATIAQLDAHLQQRLQVQVNAKVANFVEAHDGPNTLLIVYYAGHGKPGKFFGDLEIFSQTSPNDTRDPQKRFRDQIVWNKTELLLRPAEADILQIFDCCYAGTLGLTRGVDQSFEYLAAASHQATTAIPGRDSFTSALIYALEYLVEHQNRGRFTTVELLRTIKHAPHFPRQQEPRLSERGDMHPHAGRIMLHPLRREETASQAPNERIEIHLAKKHTVTLHFDFDNKPSKDHLGILGADLNGIFERNTLDVHRVRWGGMGESMLARAARRFQEPIRKRRASERRERLSQEESFALQIPQSASSPSSCLLSPPATAYHTQDSAGTAAAEAAMSSQSPAADSSEEAESRHPSSRKRRRSNQHGVSIP